MSPSPAHKTRYLTTSERTLILIMGDICLLLLSVSIALATWDYYTQRPFYIYLHLNIFYLVPIWLIIAMILGTYSLHGMKDLSRFLYYPLRANLFGGIIYALIYFFAPKGSLPRVVFLFFGVASSLLLIWWRYLYFSIFSHHRWRQNVLVISKEKSLGDIQKLIQNHQHYYQFFGFIPIDTFPQELNFSSAEVDKIVYLVDEASSSQVIEILLKSREKGIIVTSIPEFYEELTGRTPLSEMSATYMSLFYFKELPWGSIYALLKRSFDIAFSFIGLSLFFLFFPFLFFMIKIDSRGPVFYSQLRVGKNGRVFRLWKLRTMKDGLKTNHFWTEEKDPRITRFGRWLRKTRFDELPQLWNVLKGDLAVVGVRPLSVEQCHAFAEQIPYHTLRHLAKPGLTSWAVINFRHVNDLEGVKTRLEYDLYYIKNRSFWLDLYIIFRTIWIIATLKGL